MQILYYCMINDVPCTVVQNNHQYYCQVADIQYPLNHGFTEEEKSLNFLMECIVNACYKKYAASKELEGVSFD